MSRIKLFIPLIIFAVLGFLFWGGLELDPQHMPSALVGKTVPAFELQTVLEPQKTVNQEMLKGYPYALINVWATWCGPCRQEHPFLVSLAEQGVAIFGVNSQDQLPLARTWLAERGNPYIFSMFDYEGRLGLDMGVYGYPETFLIDSKGTILMRKTSVLSEAVWQQDFKPVIDELNNKHD